VYDVRQFYSARTLLQINAAMSLFAPDATLDIPLASLYGRDQIRWAASRPVRAAWCKRDACMHTAI
jgi:hypothetical protein